MPTRAERLAAETAAQAHAAETKAAEAQADPVVDRIRDDERLAAEQAARLDRPREPKAPVHNPAPEALAVLRRLIGSASIPPDEEIVAVRTTLLGSTKEKYQGDGWLLARAPHWFHDECDELFVLSPKGALYRWSEYDDGTRTPAEPATVDVDVVAIIRGYLADHPELSWPKDAPAIDA